MLRDLAEHRLPASEGVRRAVAATVALHRADPSLHRVLFEESPRPAETAATLDALREDVVRQVAGWLTRCPDAAVSDPDLAAEMVVQVIESVAHGPVIHPRGGRDPDVYAVEAARLLETYLSDGEDGDVQPHVRVAVAEAADAGEILTVQRAAYVAEAQLYGDPFLPPLVESLSQVREAISHADGRDGVVFKGCLGARVVGAVRAKRAGRVGSVGRLAVAPDAQRRGVGTALLAAVEEVLQGHVEQLVLSTGDRSDGTLRFCRRLGYAESHRERLAPHLGTVHLRKPLASA